jgi:hypothetical protein
MIAVIDATWALDAIWLWALGLIGAGATWDVETDT